MAGAAEGIAKGLLSSHQHVGIPSHISRDQNWLPDFPVTLGYVIMAWGESTGSPLSMNANPLLASIDLVVLEFGDVMADVVDEIQLESLGAHPHHPLKGFPDPVGNHLPVSKGEISRTGHGGPVPLALIGADGGTTELPIRQFDSIFRGRLKHYLDVIVAHLVSQASRSRVNGHGHLVLP